ncbi:MAG: cofactor-independent phosphoglycerate mutase, partial [Coriobacteriia bacterium]|nr:cofactor-independent phosphoglycerate mutase [Coriobacteriia bacterium]
TIEKDVMRSYSAGHIPTEQSHAIIAELSEALDDDTFRLYPGIAYRHILVVKGHPELLDLQYSPPHDITDRHVAEHLPVGDGAKLLLDYMSRAHALLRDSSVNRHRESERLARATDVWPFWPGIAPSGMVPFEQARGLRAAMTSGVDLLNGLAVLLDIDRLDIPGVTDGPDNDCAAQATGALDALKGHDLVVVHVESPDEAAHAGDAAAKIEAIEAIDREIVSRLLVHSEPIRVLAMPDHPTPVGLKTHCGEAVPFVMQGLDVKGNGARGFDEACASATGLFLDPGRGVMDLLLAD